MYDIEELTPWRAKARRFPASISRGLNHRLIDALGPRELVDLVGEPGSPWRVFDERVFQGDQFCSWLPDTVATDVQQEIDDLLADNPEFEVDDEAKRDAELRMGDDGWFILYLPNA